MFGDLNQRFPSHGLASPRNVNPFVNKYHPDRTPPGVYADEQFPNNIETLPWRWGNQNGASISYAYNSGIITLPGVAGLRARWTTPPSPQDMTIFGKFSGSSGANGTRICDLLMLTAGTEASPTQIWAIGLLDDGSATLKHRFEIWTSYGGVGGAATTFNSISPYYDCPMQYFAILYVNSSKAISLYVSYNGIHWVALGSGTASNAPIAIGYGHYDPNNANGQTICNMFRCVLGATLTMGV